MKALAAKRVLAGPDLSCIDDGVVVLDGTTISWVGARAGLPDEYADSEVKDLGDATLLPGLIDAHVHLAFDGSPHPVQRMMSESDNEQIVLMLRSARELLSVGVTTARDLGARGYTDVVVRDAIARGDARGPRLLTAGSPITTTGGHCWFMGGEADGPDAVRLKVREHHKNRVDHIKVMATGGNMTPGSAPWHAQFSGDELTVAVEEAHRLGHKVAAHCHGLEGIRRAVAAGVDSLEHCSFQKKDSFGAIDPDLAQTVADSDSYVSPTTNFRVREFRALIPGMGNAVGELYKRGAQIIMSTDAGIDGVPHYGFVGGMESLEDAGLPSQECLVAATSRSAHALGIGEVTGQLAAGLAADIIAVEGDPREGVAALHDLVLVMTNGVEFTPDPLPEIVPLSVDDLPEMLRQHIKSGGHASEPEKESA